MKIEIPNIDTVVKQTKANRDKIRNEALAKLMNKATPVFDDILIQIERAQRAGINMCSVACIDDEIVREVVKQYGEAKYDVKYTNNKINITWPMQ